MPGFWTLPSRTASCSHSAIWWEGAPSLRFSAPHPCTQCLHPPAAWPPGLSPFGPAGGPQDEHKHFESFRAWIPHPKKHGISQRTGSSWACDHGPSERDTGRGGPPSVRRKAPGVRTAPPPGPASLRHSPRGDLGQWPPLPSWGCAPKPEGDRGSLGSCHRK